MPFSFDELYEFHGHKCPMSTMGARLGLAAMRALGVTKADQFRIEGRFFNKNCALDGIQFVTGCTIGNGNLEYVNEARHAFQLARRDGSRSVTVTVSEAAFEIMTAHKKLREELSQEREISGLARAMDINKQISDDFARLVQWVQDAPESELLVVLEEHAG